MRLFMEAKHKKRKENFYDEYYYGIKHWVEESFQGKNEHCNFTVGHNLNVQCLRLQQNKTKGRLSILQHNQNAGTAQ